MRKISYLLLLLGLVITQTVKAEKTAKAIWTAGNTTMTFVYDERTYNDDGNDTYGGETITKVWVGNEVIGDDIDYDMGVRKWYNTVSSSLTKVVFDESFKDARPTSCISWFLDCTKLSTIEGLSNLNTSLVTDMSFMFNNCSGLTTLDLSSFNTSSVVEMYGMFHKCSALTTLDLSSFNTGQVVDMGFMFDGCSNLTTIVVGNGWNTDAVTYSDGMFTDCTNLLVGGKGTTFDSSNPTDKTYAHIDGGTTNPGYLTDVADIFELEITSAGMATLYYDKALKIPAGVKVYYCSGIDETKDYNVITKEITDAIPANTGVFLSGNEGHYLFSKTTDAVNDIEDNIMEGTTVEITVTPRQVLTLGHDSKGRLGFHYFTGTTIPAYKAYIPANKISASASAISFFPIKYFEDEATDISKLTEIGKVENDAIYDLAGRKVKAATKGIFIKNGKKFIVK